VKKYLLQHCGCGVEMKVVL